VIGRDGEIKKVYWKSRNVLRLTAGEDPSNNDAIIEAEIPIAKFCEGRSIPRYPLEVVKPVFDQHVPEVSLNQLDLPADKLPQTNEDMKKRIGERSRWLNPAAPAR
jgi:hypothetical protein